MNDVIPEQGLGPQNQKWRQWVERKITNLQRNMEQKFGADVNNSFKSIDSSMNLLARQIQDLRSLATVHTSTGGGPMINVSPGTYSIIPWLPTLSFDITQPSTILITSHIQFSGSTGSAMTTPLLHTIAQWSLYRDGVAIPGGHGVTESRDEVAGLSSNRLVVTRDLVHVSHDSISSVGTLTLVPTLGNVTIQGMGSGAGGPYYHISRARITAQVFPRLT